MKWVLAAGSAFLILALILFLACGKGHKAPASPEAAASSQSAKAAPDKPAAPKPDFTLGFENPGMIQFGIARPDKKKWDDHQDRISLRAVPFDSEISIPRPVALDGDYSLEFIPLVDSAPMEGIRIETYVSGEGLAEQLLDSSAPVFARDPALNGPDRLAALSRPVAVDLAPYRGKKITVRWRITKEVEAEIKAAIGRPRLRPKAQSARKPPHILLICSDTHRYDYAFGDRGKELMPLLQQFRKECVVYTRAFSNASWTLPSIASALTGLFPRYHRTGELIEKGPMDSWDKTRQLPPGQFRTGWNGVYYIFGAYPDRLVTIPEILRAANYKSALIVSNHFYIVSGLAEDGADILFDTGGIPGDLVNQSAFEMMDSLGTDEPVFLLVHYMDVHEFLKWYPLHEYPKVKTGSITDALIPKYEARVRDTDNFMSQLIHYWEEKFGTENSAIVFFSDHGEHLRDPGSSQSVGHGGTLQDWVLHVPLMVKYPVSAGVRSGEVRTPATVVDIFPTLMDLAGLGEGGDFLSGRSLRNLPLEPLPSDQDRHIFADFQLYGDELTANRQGQYKLILNLANQDKQLFDATRPLGENGELDTRIQLPETADRLAESFKDYRQRAEAASAGLASDKEIDAEETLERLRALGYVK